MHPWPRQCQLQHRKSHVNPAQTARQNGQVLLAAFNAPEHQDLPAQQIETHSCLQARKQLSSVSRTLPGGREGNSCSCPTHTHSWSLHGSENLDWLLSNAAGQQGKDRKARLSSDNHYALPQRSLRSIAVTSWVPGKPWSSRIEVASHWQRWRCLLSTTVCTSKS